MANQPPTSRPWFRFPNFGRQAPPAPAPPPLAAQSQLRPPAPQQPRPPTVRPGSAQTFRATLDQPQPAPPARQPPPSIIPFQPRAAASSPAKPPPPRPATALTPSPVVSPSPPSMTSSRTPSISSSPTTKSSETTPKQSPMNSPMLTKPSESTPKQSPMNSPMLIKSSGSTPKQSPMNSPMLIKSSESTPKQSPMSSPMLSKSSESTPKQSPMKSPMLSSASPRNSVVPPKPLSSPATNTAYLPTPTASPKSVERTAQSSPSPRSPIKTTRSPPPISLPPSHLQSSKGEVESRTLADTDQKNVFMQETVDKQMIFPAVKGNPVKGFINTYNNPNKYGSFKEADDHSLFPDPKDVRSGRLITMAGENKGAIMGLGVHGHGGNPHGNISGSFHNVGNDAEESDGYHSGNANWSNDKGIPSHLPRNAYVNSNVQGVNDSILYNCSINHHDPGVHFSLSRKPLNGHNKGNGQGIKYNANGKQF